MQSGKNKYPKQKPERDLESELDQLEDGWDEILRRGDDDFYEVFRQHPRGDNKARSVEKPRKERRKGTRI